MKYILPLLLITVIAGCKPKEKPAEQTTTVATPAAAKNAEDPAEYGIRGLYRADFGGSPIYITINYTNGVQVAGFNLHKGLRRNLRGHMTAKGNSWEVVLDEPGDHAYDGSFRLVFDHDFELATGNWTPKSNSQLTVKQLKLERAKNDDLMKGMSYVYSGENADIMFDEDGSCEYTWYARLGDSTFSKQLSAARGSWERQGDSIIITWERDNALGRRESRWAALQLIDTIEGNAYEHYVLRGDSIEMEAVEF